MFRKYFPGLSWLPVSLGGITSLCFVTTYAIAVGKGDVTALFPYISDTGANPPESCIFGLLLNISAFLGGVIMFIRYRVVVDYTHNYDAVARLNRNSLFCGLLAMFGMMIVAAFQDTAVLIVHLIGAAMVFGFGVIYTGIHCVISSRAGIKGALLKIRIASWALSLVGLVGCVGAAAVAYFTGNRQGTGTAIWESGTDGFVPHVISTFSEWLMGLNFLVFFVTYYREFKPLKLDVLVKSIEGAHHAELKADGTYYEDDERQPLVNS